MAAAELQECPSPTAPHGSAPARTGGCEGGVAHAYIHTYILCINFDNLLKTNKQPSTVLLPAYLIRI